MFLRVLCCAVALCLCLAVPAAERFFIPAASGAITVDGQLTDWGRGGIIAHIDQDHLAGGWLDNTFRGPQDCQGDLYLAYDAKYLYAAIDVTDDSAVPMTAKPALPGKFWLQDGLGLYLDAPALGAVIGRYNTKPTHSWQQEPIIQLTPGENNYGAEVLPAGSKYACITRANGYVVEIAYPWESLGWQPLAGDRLFFSAILVDYDKTADGKIGPLRQIIWHQSGNDVRPMNRLWAEARLLNPAGFGSEVMAAPSVVTKGAAIAWKVMADAVQPGWKVTAVTLTGPGKTAKVLAKPGAGVTTAATFAQSGAIDTASLPTGAFTLEVTATKGSLSQTARQTLTIIDAPSTPAASAAPGLPKSYLLPDPLRGYRSAESYAFPHKPVTHADYLAFVKEEIEAGWPSFQYHLTVKSLTLGGSWYQEYGLRMAAYAKITNDPVWIKRAQDMLEMADAAYKANKYQGLGWINFPLLYYYKQYLSAVNAWKPEYDGYMQDWYLHVYPKFPDTYFYGMNNWGLANGIMGVAGKYWLGNALPDAVRWQVQVDNTWGLFRDKIKDIDENTTNYAIWDMWMVLNYLDMTNQTQLIKTDPQLRAFFERYMLETAPSGARPHYGSTNGWHDAPAAYMYIFERVGQITGDGRYKAQARLMWDYSQRHVSEWHSYHLVFDQTLTFLTRLLAEVPDDSLPAVPLAPVSVVTQRAKMRVLSPAEGKERHEWTETLPERVPGKIVLRGSTDPNSLFALVELNADAGHCSARPTSINCLMDKDTVLLASQSYNEYDVNFHNMVWIEDLEGTQKPQPPMDVTVPVFQDTPVMTYAVAQVDRYQRYPVTVRRHYFFAKDRFFWVRDELAFQDRFFARIGPSWLSRQLYSSGANWANTYYDILPYTGLGQGGTFYWKNPNYDLLTWMAPRPGMSLTLTDFSSKNLYMNAPLSVRQTWMGMTAPEKPLVFDSLLISHPIRPRQLDASWLADTIQPLAVADDQTVLQFELPWKREKVFVLTGAKPFENATIYTDAAQAMVVWRDGKVINWWARQATLLKVDGTILFTAPAKADGWK
jgi:hypothetical protein